MTSKNKYHEKKVIRKPSKNDATKKSTVKIEGGSSVQPNPVGVYLWGVDLMNVSNEDKEKELGRENGEKYKGVRQRKWGKWVAEVYNPRTKGRVWLGTFNTAEEAALVYNKAAIAIRGVNAVKNIIKPTPRDLPSTSSDDDRVLTQFHSEVIKWVAEVYNPRTKGRVWLGTFNTAEEAALVYNKASIAIRGVNAVTNIIKPAPRETYHQQKSPPSIHHHQRRSIS
ncbi:hypothetical protein MTR67_000647 [Solanum verrucosum]|uniref:AP2/ERF domain-containing protein n=1 Tax=Solanum verrucosum TaxID=315347 RepID=A0AAF0PMT8_SOLVR|nr:hypothetical protein MTR67_000647 [Solanum verrucosum]